jgi:hypothetical protein
VRWMHTDPLAQYGDMQLITEAYDILKRGFGMKESEIADGELLDCTGALGTTADAVCDSQSSTPGTRASSTRT